MIYNTFIMETVTVQPSPATSQLLGSVDVPFVGYEFDLIFDI